MRLHELSGLVFDALFSTHLGRDPLADLGYMVFEAILAVIVFLAFVSVLIFYRGSAATKKPLGVIPERPGKDDGA